VREGDVALFFFLFPLHRVQSEFKEEYLSLVIRFKASLRGHVGAVYQVCWSSDSRMLVSGSKDSTVKLWDLATNKLKVDMPGHADEVYRYVSHLCICYN
jgi:WD40 repeat protein